MKKYYLLLGVGIFLTILSGVFWDKIPLFITVGIYSKEVFWESFFINLNSTILDVIIIGSFITLLNKKKEKQFKIKNYLEKLDTYRKYYKGKIEQVYSETFICLDKLYELGYNIKDLNGNIFYNGELLEKKFYKTELKGVNFIKTYLRDIEFIKCFLKGNKIQNCKIQNITFKNDLNAEINNMNFINCEEIKNFNSINGIYKGLAIENSKFNNLFFKNTTFENLNLKNSQINSFQFIGCTFINLTVEDMKFNTGKFENCIFQGKNVKKNIKLIKVKNSDFLENI